MRIANLADRAVLLTGDGTAVDVADASGGRFGPSPRAVFEAWDEFTAWAAEADHGAGRPFDPAELGAPVPDPRQVFAIGLNYRDHADEANLDHPEDLVVFTKFASALAGPDVTVELPSDRVDYEIELVVVIGRRVHRVGPEEAVRAIAGYAVGQDYSERAVQLRGPVPQFSLGKSYPNFAPFGPAVVTEDELDDPGKLRLTAVLEGPSAGDEAVVTLQDGTTADLIFPVERIVSDLSQVVTLHPGDVVFTGTPAGVGAPRGLFLRPGDVLTSTIEGVGTMTNRFVAR
ncbi:fumarylacetoacetate hydrolase family protein [Pseudonocardia broussonetiae]|uniref:Fumarylacetoacetate hydrolase family protein n=1 Tax=Pseudonocardia broussonetiae TaxID=2736640 RepID=A0A6M6JKE7_9PSEU|nr:fumarylacetoacetate hydrolase family protein [Pseudonocardia broussonetiae]QJY47417.1 fumarylacetoacetate hydrolase family protein [Pseudonocardia broussonetiae]